MKSLRFIFIFMLFSFTAIASDCPLSDVQKNKLINESPYFVDDVRCRDEIYNWTISNRRVMGNEAVLPVVIPKTKPLAKVEPKKPLSKKMERIVERREIQVPPIKAPVVIARPAKVKSKKIEVNPVASSPELKNKAPSRGISFIPGLNEWNTSVSYGAKYLSMNQNGSLIKNADVSVTLFNNIKLNSEFLFENWSAWVRFETYRFKYATLTKEDSKSMNLFEVGASYKWLIASLAAEENPLFRNNAGEVELSKMSILYAGVGAKKDIEIPSLSPTYLRLKGLVRLPVSTGTDDTNVKTSGVSGFGAVARAEVSRQIYDKMNYSLHLTCMTDLSYQSLSQDVKWDTQSSNATTSILSASAGLGLVFSLK